MTAPAMDVVTRTEDSRHGSLTQCLEVGTGTDQRLISSSSQCYIVCMSL